jgi:ATP-dependent helicase/nuclease subunit A
LSRVLALPDQDARERIARDLDTNLLVEAGAGSGKTWSLIERMVSLVATGTAEVSEVAAVTFTRKAAGELRERFQEALEKARRTGSHDRATAERLERALREIDRAFMGTIHAFCARLLREQPLEAGIDPSFRETTALEAEGIADRFWILHLERLAAQADPILDQLLQVGLRPEELHGLYRKIREQSDVEFPVEETPFPPPESIRSARESVDALLAEAVRLLPPREPEKGWDDLQKWLRKLLYLRRAGRWQDDRVFLNTLADFCGVREHDVTQYKWGDAKVGKEFGRRVNLFIRVSPAADAVRLWQTHRYPFAIRFARQAAGALAEFRRSTGQVDFQDLLLLTARVLRRSPAARRHLGERYRRLLVDEFQDTDPLQAEILFLLAAEPETPTTSDRSDAEVDWRTVEPRPGALFVVGDPKQSIYRFRRADIQLYGQVRDLFRSFGDVVSLESNFRSSEPIAELVNATFAGPGGFPAEATPEQAPFAWLVPRGQTESPTKGVYWYEVASATNTRIDMSDWDAEALAGWIAGRVASGERQPGDFLVLLRTKAYLDKYARALEARNLPVQVSGAAVGIEAELGEVRVLLEALADPGDPVRTVAALVGLFFGLDHQQLHDHHMGGGAFDLRFAREQEPMSTVEAALLTLKKWWHWTREQPADAAVSCIVDELGLLPWAAAGDLGGVRAGALAFALDALRGAGLAGDTSLGAALEAMDAALAEEETEAPLEPGREDVVRLMNLHKAKGLEAEVVVLARPFTNDPRDPVSFVERRSEGTAGWILVKDEQGKKSRVLARPRDWDQKEAAERLFAEAEEVRLLYVAATRAKEELVVALPKKLDGKSPWSPLYGWLLANGVRAEVVRSDPPTRERLLTTAQDLAIAVSEADWKRRQAAEESWRFVTVTRIAKSDDVLSLALPSAGDPDAAPVPPPPLSLEPGSEDGPGGHAWGSAVHAVLEVAAGGADRERVRALARSLLLEMDRPAPGGEPAELDALLATVDRVLGSDLWRRARSAARSMAEVPFTLQRAGSGAPSYLEGVIDLAFAEEDGWVVVDYKTDRGTDPDFPTRRNAYRAQLALYGDAWQELTGERVKERLLWFVRSGLIEAV